MPERNEKGHFVKGNKGSPGRKSKKQELREVEQLQKIFDIDARKKILNVILKNALEGDKYCIQFVAERFWPAEWVARQIVGESTTDVGAFLTALEEAKKVTRGK